MHPGTALTQDRPQCYDAMSEVFRPLNRSTSCVSVNALFSGERLEESTEHAHGV